MNQAKVTDLDYIHVLVATPVVVSCTQAARVQPLHLQRTAHDALTRVLHRLTPDSTPLWHEVEQHVNRHAEVLIVDDTTWTNRMLSTAAWSIVCGPARIIEWFRGLTS